MNDLLELAAIAAYGAFAQSSADRLGEMPPWAAIPPGARADWRAVADAVQMVTAPHLRAAWAATVTGYRIGDSVYHPADVTIIRKEDPGAT